jgi:dipeptidyl aminopeptidase/acylaminoacyl peptidase
VKRPLVPADLYRLALASDPLLLPDGRGVIACIATFDRERDAIVRRVCWFDDSGVRDVSDGPADTMLALAPDGRRVAFVAAADGASHLTVVDLDALDARRAGPAFDAAADPAWSPDGNALAFTALAAREDADAAIFRDERTGALHVRGGPYKDDARGLLDGRTRALFVVEVATGVARRIVACGDDLASPSWSPDGRSIAYARRDAGRRARMQGTIEIVDVVSGGVRAVSAGDGPAYAPVFAPDGRTIAFAGHRHGNDNRFGCEAFVVPVTGGEPRSLTRARDRPVGNVLCGDLRSGTTPRLAWLSGGTELAMLVTDGGACNVVAVSLDAGASRTLAGGDRDISGFALGPHGALAITYATPVEPSAIARVDASGERVVASLNPWLAGCALVQPERVSAMSDGTPIDAWLLAPPSAGARAPLVLDVHPGPHAAFGSTFVLLYQILADCGIGVAYANPRGSLGYGEAFALGTTGDWGGGDARDLLAVLDATLARGNFDPQRVACTGQSYGGFMTTWLLGHTARFATGISLDAVNDFASLYGASDVGWSMETELATDVASDAGRTLFERSALRAARSIAVPLLIVHGARDERCPIDQAEQLYNTLRYAGTSEVEFVRFANGTHELSRSGNPHERILRLRAIANWLTQHLGVADATDARARSLFAPIPAESPLFVIPSGALPRLRSGQAPRA